MDSDFFHLYNCISVIIQYFECAVLAVLTNRPPYSEAGDCYCSVTRQPQAQSQQCPSVSVNSHVSCKNGLEQKTETPVSVLQIALDYNVS